jgi:hypothetical protein
MEAVHRHQRRLAGGQRCQKMFAQRRLAGPRRSGERDNETAQVTGPLDDPGSNIFRSLHHEKDPSLPTLCRRIGDLAGVFNRLWSP